jgi:UDP-glucose 4-epimerase
VFDNLTTGHRWAVRWGPFVEGDLADKDKPYAAMEHYDVETADGTAQGDYTHAADLADARRNALQHVRSGGKSHAFNLVTGRGYSVREIVRKVEEICGKRVQSPECSRKPGDPPVLIAETSNAERELKWPARYSDWDTIVSTAWHWLSRSISAELPAGRA